MPVGAFGALAALPVLAFFEIVVERIVLGYLHGGMLKKTPYWRLIWAQLVHGLGSRPLYPYGRLAFTSRLAVLARFSLSCLLWYFTPLAGGFARLGEPWELVFILVIFSIQCALECFIGWLCGSKFTLLTINRKVIAHFTSQGLLVLVFLSLAITINAPDWAMGSMKAVFWTHGGLPILIFCLALLCKDGLGAFAFCAPPYGLLEGDTLEFSPRMFALRRIAIALDRLFSCALLVSVFFSSPLYVDPDGIIPQPSITLFLLKLFPVLLAFLWVHGSVLIRRADQWLLLCQRVVLPLALGLLLFSIWLKFVW